MDIGTSVQRKVDSEEEKRKEAEENDLGRALIRVEADLGEAMKLTDSLAELENHHAWLNFYNILLRPAREKVVKEIQEIQKDLKNHPEKVTQLVYNQAFLEVLTIMCDFENLRKDNLNHQKQLKVRIQELTNKIDAKNKKGSGSGFRAQG
jgi:hypothetical protein